MEEFARPAAKLSQPLVGSLDVAVAPSAGRGLALDASGKIPLSLTSRGIYRKTTAKQVVNTVAETDLLNGEIRVAGNAMGATGLVRLTAWGDWKQSSGGTTNVPRFKLKLGATTLLDTSVLGASVVGSNPNRYGWRIACEIQNLGATNSQWVTLDGRITFTGTGSPATGFFAGGNYLVPSTTATDTMASALGGLAAAVDTTVSNVLALSVILPVANASCDITLKSALVEIP